MAFEKPLIRLVTVVISLLICLSAIPLLHGTFAALVITVVFQVYLPGYLLASVLNRITNTHPIVAFAWTLLCGLGLAICLGAITRVLSLSVPVYIVFLHGMMFGLVFCRRRPTSVSEPQWQFSRKSLLPFGLLLISCLVAIGVNYESRNRFYGFEDQSIFISLMDWIVTHPDVRPQGVPILSRQIGIVNGDVRMATDGWTYAQASWVWTSGVSARQLVWYDLSTLFIWTIPLIHFALAYELTRRESTAGWTTVSLALAALMTLDNFFYNPTYTAYGRFVLFQINVNRQASIALILPLALLSGLTYLRTLSKADLGIVGLGGLALASMHPIPTTIYVFSLGITAFLKWLANPRWGSLKSYIPLGIVLILLMGLPFLQRFLFFGTKPALSLGDLADVASNSSPSIVFLRQLPLLSETYIRRPSSVFYSPIIIATVVIGLLMGLRWRRSLIAQYIFGTTILALFLFFTPGVTALVDKFGSFITLLTLMFILPVSLTLGVGIEYIVKWVSRYTTEQFAQIVFGVGVLFAIVLLLFEPLPIVNSARDQIQAFNNLQTLRLLHPSQTALMQTLRTLLPSDAITVFMTPSDIANVILEEVPGVLITGGRDQGMNQAAAGDARFYTNTIPNAPWLDNTDLDFMKQFGMTHIIMMADGTRLPQMLLDSERFTLLNTTDGYRIFQVNPNLQPDSVDELFVKMNDIYAQMSALRWGRDGFDLTLPGSSELWNGIVAQWQTLLQVEPENNRARLGLAYTYLMMGDDHKSLPLWAALNSKYSDIEFFADAEASAQQILDATPDSIRPLMDDLSSEEPSTRVLAARRLMTDTFFYHLSSDQLAQVLVVTQKDATTWERLANFDQPANVRKRAALIMDRGEWETAKAWMETIPQAERSPEDIATLGIIGLLQKNIDSALQTLKPTTDTGWIAANVFLHGDRWQNNIAAQMYFLLLGNLAQRDGRNTEALTNYQQANRFGSRITAPYFMSQIVSTDQALALLDEAKTTWAENHDNSLPELASLLTITDTSNPYVMQPIIERGQNEDVLKINALYGNIRPRGAFPIENWRIQVVSPDSTVKYAEAVVPAEFVDGALVDVTTDVVIASDVPDLASALVYIEPRFNNVVTAAPAITSIVLNRPDRVDMPSESDRPDLKFGDEIILEGYSLRAAVDHLDVNLYWKANSVVSDNYQVFVHILGADGQQIDGQDSAPLNNRYPTSQWRTGLTIADNHNIPYSGPLPDGIYTVEIGLYRLSDGVRLAISPAGELIRDNTLIIGTFER